VSLLKERQGGGILAYLNRFFFLFFFFSLEEVKKILSIPLSSTNKEDILLWRGTTKGDFSVHSAYHLQKEMEKMTTASCSTQHSYSDVWDKIWRMQVSNVEKKKKTSFGKQVMRYCQHVQIYTGGR
jgi:hypothetical protein